MTRSTQSSPIRSTHEGLGARFVDFGGWDMPVQYQSVLSEHAAVRDTVGIFDVSHLGRLDVSGSGATATLAGLFCNDARDFEPGRSHYTMLLNEAGGIVDDIVVWRWADEHYWVLPNAANSDTVATAIADNRQGTVDVEDLRPTTAFFAVQGPAAPDLIAEVLGEAPRRFRTAVAGSVRMAGTGYTGEPGGELCVPADAAGELWQLLTAAGAVPCGLGSRDTLRLEAGLPLWGEDIDESTTPIEAGLDFAVAWDHEFRGKEALALAVEEGPKRRLRGLVMDDRGIPRPGYRVRSGDAEGEVTSGNLSPGLNTGIALAYLSPPTQAEGDAEVEIRGVWVAAHLATPPFHQ